MTDWPTVVAAHGPAVWRTVVRLLGPGPDAADCYQDTFLAACRSAPAGVRDWGAFLVALAARRAVDRLRRRVRGRTVSLPADPPAAGPDPSAGLEVAELLDAVRRHLAELPPRQAEAFWLSAVEGLPHDRIASHLGVSPGAVRVLVHRARAALAAALADTWSRP